MFYPLSKNYIFEKSTDFPSIFRVEKTKMTTSSKNAALKRFGKKKRFLLLFTEYGIESNFTSSSPSV